jgi:tetratricopeptide (TPR) repeat protein
MVILAMVFVALPAPVAAQGEGDESDQELSEEERRDQKKAEAFYDKGVKAFFEKNFPQAITYFQRAHSLDPSPVVLYNISLAHSKMGNASDALQASLEAQKMEGLPEDTVLKNEYRIAGYRRVVTAIGVAEAINPPQARDGSSDKDKPSPKVEEDSLGAVGWAGLGTAGLGVGALVGAGVLNFIIAGNLDEYDTARADGDYGRASGLHSDIGDRQEMGRVLLYSGAGLLAVGSALFAYDYFGSPEAAGSADQASVFGAVDADGATVQLRWAF